MKIYASELLDKQEPKQEAPVISSESEVLEEVTKIEETEVVDEKADKFIIKLNDLWLKSFRPYLKTPNRTEAILLDLKVAESYLPLISLYRKIKGSIEKA